MRDVTLEQEILEAVQKLDTDMQRHILEIVRGLTRPKGTPGYLAVQYAREIGFSHEDLDEMEKAINTAKEEAVDDFPEVHFDE